MQRKRRPLVSGDVVMLTWHDDKLKRFTVLRTPPEDALQALIAAGGPGTDPLLSTDQADTHCFFVIRNVKVENAS
jgi:hypothetical protein